MIYMGIDPGSRFTGYGLVRMHDRRLSCVSAGRITLKDQDHCDRLVLIFDHLSDILQEFKPDIIAIESIFVQKNVQSALKLGQARGAALVACAKYGRVPVEISPRSVKQCVTGSGSAGKDAVAQMVKRLLGTTRSLSVDASDALAIAISASMLK